MIGRDAERRVLDELAAGTRLGRSGVLVVTGDAGIGKTTLLDHLASRAEGIELVRVAGSTAERDLAFAGLALALRPTDADLDRIPRPQARALRVALALEEGDPVDRFAVGAATLSVLARRAEDGPVGLILDDAHHLDRPSADALVFAARRLLADPVLLVAAVRAGLPSPLLSAGLPLLVLDGLTDGQTRDLMTRGLGRTASAETGSRVHAATGGNPLAVLQLAGDPRAMDTLASPSPIPVPAAVAENYVRRADGLGEGARTLLALCATAGGDLTVVTGAATDLGVDLALLARAEQAGLVVGRLDRVEFTHPLIGSALYAAVPPAERRALHAAVADRLPERDLERRAWHRAEAALGPDEGAARAMRAVADESLHRGAYAVAAAALERAARLTGPAPDRAEDLARAASAAWSGGDGESATRLLDEATALDPSPARRARVMALRGLITARTGSLDTARDLLLTAARQLATEDAEQALGVIGEAVNTAFYLADARAAEQAAELARTVLAPGLRPTSAGLAHLAVGMAEVIAGGGGEEMRTAVTLLAEGAAAGEHPPDVTWALLGPLWLRESGASRRALDAVQEARDRTTIGVLPRLLFILARDGATTDRWGSAASDYAEAIALADELGQTTEATASLAGLAWLEARQGLEEECRAHATRALEQAGPRHLSMAVAWSRWALAELDLSAGRFEQSVESLTGLESWLAEHRIHDVDLSPGPELVEALLRAGDRPRAEQVAERHAAAAESKGQPWSRARAARTAGLLAPVEALDAAFGSALLLHEQTPDDFETARTRLAYGGRLRRARRRVDARAQLRAALADFHRLGARPWAEVAADELEATGENVQRHGRAGLDLLTPRERQIVAQLTRGRTTREAAAALFLSPKTVEYHLRHVYTKLEIATRAELVGLVEESELAQQPISRAPR